MLTGSTLNSARPLALCYREMHNQPSWADCRFEAMSEQLARANDFRLKKKAQASWFCTKPPGRPKSSLSKMR